METPQKANDYTESVHLLLEDIADHGEHFALVALPEFAPSFVADLRGRLLPELPRLRVVDWQLPDLELRTLREVVRRAARTGADNEAPSAVPFTLRMDAAGPWISGAASDVSVEVGQDDAHTLVRRLLAALLNVDGVGEASSDSEVDDDGWGPVASADEAEAVERENLRVQVEQRREQLAKSFTRKEVAELLGVSAQTVSDMLAEGRLVGLKDARSWKLPAWQFTPDLEDPVLPEVGRLAQSFPGGVVSLSRWMNRPNDNFDGRTPAQEMVRDSDHVFAVIGTLMAA
ncbi:hypothetical protein [Rhodococcus olei]|uniref:hypothetical protein n=1 Tax=Rhodococcus olei TaxID=2161675 RepID=UPI0031ED0E88